MNKLRKIQLSIVAVVVAGLLVGAGTYMTVPTFAQENDNQTKEAPINRFLSKVASILGIEEETLTSAMDQAKQEIHDEAKEELKAKLQASVDNGEITQEQADAKLEVFDKGFNNTPKKWGKDGKKQKGFDKHEKGDDIRSQIRDRKPNWPDKPQLDIAKIQAELKELVAKGEITQEEADEKLKELKNNKPGFPGKRGPDPRDMEAIKSRIQKAIDDGEITQEQADERLNGLKAPGRKPPLPPNAGDIERRLKEAVESGSITEKEAMERFKNLSQRIGEIKPPSEADIKDRIKVAVDSGQITQEQAEERYKAWTEGLKTRGVK